MAGRRTQTNSGPDTPPNPQDGVVHEELTKARDRIADLESENARLLADVAGRDTEIHNLTRKVEELSGIAGDQRRELARNREELGRRSVPTIPVELPGIYYALREGHTDPTAREALEERLIETEEELDALMDARRIEGRVWVNNPAELVALAAAAEAEAAGDTATE